MFFLPKHRPGLFRSQSWLKAWRDSWSDHTELELLTTEHQTTLSTSIFCYRQKIKSIFATKTAFPLGVSTPAAPSIRSEYFIFHENVDLAEKCAVDYFASSLAHKWDQIYIPDVLDGSVEFFCIQSAAKKNGLDCVIKDVSTTYAIDLRSTDFAGYLKSIGPNTRLKLFNRRKNLSSLGKVHIENIWPAQEKFYNLLNQFHEKRWGKPCYSGRNEKFMYLLLENLVSEGHKVDLSVMTVGELPVSVVLDIGVNGRIYNLQSGYIENFAKNISLGTLHFGYQIESAFAANDVEFYDFMAGNGKNSNYKTLLANSEAQFNSFMLVRNPLLKLMYRLQKLLN